jgi:hypothetical protein
MNFKDFLHLSEASYEGNIGMMEMFTFYQVASPEQKTKMKQLIFDKKMDDAWEFLQQVIGVKLHSPAFAKLKK